MKFACFHCRKVFNKPEGDLSPDVLSGRVAWTPPDYACDECGEPLHFTGAEFRPPSRRSLDQWRKAELLIRSGFLFHKDVGPYPETLSEARKFVETQQRPRDICEARQLAQKRRMPNKSAAANRRPAGQLDGSDNLSATIAADQAFPAAAAELGSLGIMQNPRSKSKHSIIPVMMTVALIFLIGCKPDKDVTTLPQYNFSSFTNTVWKTKTKTAIAETVGYSGGPKFFLLPPADFDPTDTNFIRSPDVKSIAVLPPGTRLRITRLLQGQGQQGGYGVEAVVEDGTKAPKTAYVDHGFLVDVLWQSRGPTSNTNWGVNPDMLEKP